jgi:hypothetical protein
MHALLGSGMGRRGCGNTTFGPRLNHVCDQCSGNVSKRSARGREADYRPSAEWR